MSPDQGVSSFSLQMSMQIIGERRISQSSVHRLGIQIVAHLGLPVNCVDRLLVLNRMKGNLSLVAELCT